MTERAKAMYEFFTEDVIGCLQNVHEATVEHELRERLANHKFEEYALRNKCADIIC